MSAKELEACGMPPPRGSCTSWLQFEGALPLIHFPVITLDTSFNCTMPGTLLLRLTRFNGYWTCVCIALQCFSLKLSGVVVRPWQEAGLRTPTTCGRRSMISPLLTIPARKAQLLSQTYSEQSRFRSTPRWKSVQ